MPRTNSTLFLPDEEPPQSPDEDEEDAQEPALHDGEGDGQHEGVGVILDHDEELRHRYGRRQPRLLAQLFVELPVGRSHTTRDYGKPIRPGRASGAITPVLTGRP